VKGGMNVKKFVVILALVVLALAFTGCHGVWSSKAQLKEIVIDGRLVKGFQPYIYEYTYVVPQDYEGIPTVIAIPEKADYTVSYSYPDELPGVITISVTPGSHSGTQLRETFYRVNILVADGI
jgi:hypothetical protein